MRGKKNWNFEREHHKKKQSKVNLTKFHLVIIVVSLGDTYDLKLLCVLLSFALIADKRVFLFYSNWLYFLNMPTTKSIIKKLIFLRFICIELRFITGNITAVCCSCWQFFHIMFLIFICHFKWKLTRKAKLIERKILSVFCLDEIIRGQNKANWTKCRLTKR